MKIKVCELGGYLDDLYKSDMRAARQHGNRTYLSDYSMPFEEMDVTIDELVELANKGASIKINC
jgi:hypothetical protein